MTRNFQCQPELTLRPWTPWSVKKMIQGLLGRLRIESIFQLEVTFLNFRFGNIFSSVTLYRYAIVYYISWVLRTMHIRISTSDRQKVLWYVIKALIWTKIGTNYWLFTLCFMFFVVKLVDWLEFSLVHDRIIFGQEKYVKEVITWSHMHAVGILFHRISLRNCLLQILFWTKNYTSCSSLRWISI